MAASNDGSTMFGINTVQGQVSSEYLQPTAAPEVDSAPSLPTISQGPVKDEGPDSSSSLTIPRAPMEQASLDKRMDFVLECSRRAGFANFDSAVSSYYIAEFSDSSVAANAQRLSRKRHLPRVLVDLRETAEAQGYSDEILKSAENLLVAECSNRSEIASISKLFSIDSLNPKTSHQSSFELSNELQDPQKIAQLKKSFQYAVSLTLPVALFTIRIDHFNSFQICGR
ncbi:uncharacterized protein LY89DRAFT_422906 [Mollisia scopiformis]|uniref:Uncharacterized protein n=1 Tax=Mollisia scopiformis TaxID=149040 RepID=A0A194XLK6_MOLSC|nr:uncharacterized protein LY89DRAFT_422906 [Mollisia scopiformis]KUJ21016.1 hypothetical protein LY89DRAFT_422906 [Mollisia scopiformis]